MGADYVHHSTYYVDMLDKNLTKNHKTHLIKNRLGFFKQLGNIDVSFSRSRLIPAIFFYFFLQKYASF